MVEREREACVARDEVGLVARGDIRRGVALHGAGDGGAGGGGAARPGSAASNGGESRHGGHEKRAGQRTTNDGTHGGSPKGGRRKAHAQTQCSGHAIACRTDVCARKSAQEATPYVNTVPYGTDCVTDRTRA